MGMICLKNPTQFVEVILEFYNSANSFVQEMFTEKDNPKIPSKEFARAVDNACKTVVNVRAPFVQGGRHVTPAASLLAQFCDQALKDKTQDMDYYNKAMDDAVKVFQ